MKGEKLNRLTRIIEDGPIKVLTICQARCGAAEVWREWSVSKDSAIEDALLKCAAYENTNLMPDAIERMKAELAGMRTAISKYCHNDCYRDSCEGNEDVGIPDCALAKYAPLPESQKAGR